MAEEQRASIFFRLIEFFLLSVFYTTRLLVRILPPSIAYAMFKCIGYTLYRSRSGMREHLLQNLGEALPGIDDPRELERIAKEACCAPFLPMLDMIVFKNHREHFLGELSVEGMEHLAAADSEGKGVIVFSPHLGAFSVITAAYTHLGKLYTPLVLPPSSSPVPRYVLSLALYAQSLGCDRENPAFLTGKDTIAKVREHLAKGKRVGITFDIEGDMVMDFFGRPTALASGIAHFAYDSGAPIVPSALLRGDSPLKCGLKIYEPLTYELSGDRSSDVKAILSEVVKSGEELIREAPEQWMGWFGLRHWRMRADEMRKHED